MAAATFCEHLGVTPIHMQLWPREACALVSGSASSQLCKIWSAHCSIQCLRKIGAWKFFEEELLDSRHAIPWYGGFVRLTVCAETLTSNRRNAWTTELICTSLCTRAKSAESTRHKSGHLDRNFIHEND